MKKIIAAVCLALAIIMVTLVGMTLAFCAADDPRLFTAVTDAAARSVSDAAAAAGAGLKNAALSVGEGAQDAAGAVHTFFDRSTVLEAVPGTQVQVLALREAQPPEEAEPVPSETLPAPSGQPEAVTALLPAADGGERLTGGVELVYYDQRDARWAEEDYGGYPLEEYGCGPVSMAMAVSSLTGTAVDPAEMARWCVEQDYCAGVNGSYVSIVSGTAREHGLVCRSLDYEDAAGLLTALAEGGVAVALMGQGHFPAGHYILLHGATSDGRVLIADPDSRERSLALWDVELILEELAPRHASGAPLWLLTPGDTPPEAETEAD